MAAERSKSSEPRLSRRGFLHVMTAAGGGLMVGVALPGCARHSIRRREMAETADATGELVPNAWIKITRQSEIIFTLDRVEMGQGTMTSHTMMVAEELEVAPASIRVELAKAERAYDNPLFNLQVTGGSTSVASSWEPLRKAAAATREMLRKAAAVLWEVEVSECVAQDGEIVHQPTSRRARYGELTEIAAYLEIPDPELKPREQFKVIGKAVPRLDAPMKVDGTAVFGMDVVVPGMLTAVVVRPPTIGGAVQSFRADAALAKKGVRHVFTVPSGVAVVADTYWQARRGAALVEVDWQPGPLAGFSTKGLRDRMAALAANPGKTVRQQGDVDAGLREGTKVIEAVYELPYLAHATMEPMSCTAHVTPERCEIWAPSQAPGLARETAAAITGLRYEDVTVHATLLGGGFGRRLAADFVAEAVHVARQVDKPVKVIWSREDDTRNDYYRPQTYNILKGAVDGEGKPVAWFHRLVGQSIMGQIGQEWLPAMSPDWMPRVAKMMVAMSAARMFEKNVITDQSSVEGASTLPYGIRNLAVEYVEHEPGVPVGFWRSVGHSENAFITESFIDELAHAAGADPYRFRRELLERAPRNRAVLDLAADKAGWAQPPAAGRFRGIAQHESFGSYCAQVAEISLQGEQLRVHRVVCAIDCGLVVNPDIVHAQMESAIVYGLSAALKQAITIEDGRVRQSNFHDYPALRMYEMPVVEVHIVASDEPPSGVGEPGLPPVAPVVANAIFAATGKRIRRLPIEPELRAGRGDTK